MISAIPSIERRPPSHRLTDSLGRSQDHPASDPIGALRRHRIAYIRMMYFFFLKLRPTSYPPGGPLIRLVDTRASQDPLGDQEGSFYRF